MTTHWPIKMLKSGLVNKWLKLTKLGAILNDKSMSLSIPTQCQKFKTNMHDIIQIKIHCNCYCNCNCLKISVLLINQSFCPWTTEGRKPSNNELIQVNMENGRWNRGSALKSTCTIYFASAAVAVDSSHTTASSPTSQSRFTHKQTQTQTHTDTQTHTHTHTRLMALCPGLPGW